MSSREIEEFARLLVEEVRDAAVRSCDNLLDPHAASPAAKRWREAALTDQLIRTAIPDADAVILEIGSGE